MVVCSLICSLCFCYFQVMTVKKRYEVGLEKLQTTESSVQGMQVNKCGGGGWVR